MLDPGAAVAGGAAAGEPSTSAFVGGAPADAVDEARPRVADADAAACRRQARSRTTGRRSPRRRSALPPSR